MPESASFFLTSDTTANGESSPNVTFGLSLVKAQPAPVSDSAAPGWLFCRWHRRAERNGKSTLRSRDASPVSRRSVRPAWFASQQGQAAQAAQPDSDTDRGLEKIPSLEGCHRGSLPFNSGDMIEFVSGLESARLRSRSILPKLRTSSCSVRSRYFGPTTGNCFDRCDDAGLARFADRSGDRGARGDLPRLSALAALGIGSKADPACCCPPSEPSHSIELAMTPRPSSVTRPVK